MEQTGGYNFSIKGLKNLACQTMCTTLHFVIFQECCRNSNGLWYVWVYLLGTKTEARDFTYEIKISTDDQVLWLELLLGSQQLKKISKFCLLTSEIRPKQVQAKFFKIILFLFWSIPFSQRCKLAICGMKKLM